MRKCLHCGHEAETDAKFCPECGTRLGESKPGRTSLVGTTLSQKYRIERQLGVGGMGTVYLAEHTSLKKQVAVKVLHPDLYVSPESIQRFQREGIAAGQFSHSGAIQIFDFDQDSSGVFYLAMEYVDGRSLSQLLRQEGALPLERAIAIIAQVLRVLAEAHARGIVHRDLKPDNIMVLSGTEDDVVKVLDFGLSKLVDVPLEASLMTQTGRIMGTPQYMSPEQCSGKEVDARSDLYAVGLILYELLAGTPTFGGDSIPEILVKHTSQPPPSLVDTRPELRVPADLDAWIERALRKDPAERFSDAGEMLTVLENVRRDHFRKPRRRGPRIPREKRNLIGVGVLGVLALAWGLLGESESLGGGRGDVPLLSMLAPEDLKEVESRYLRHLLEAERALERRDFDLALISAEDALRLDCRDAQGYLLRARVFAARGDLDTARADAEEALRRHPGYAEVEAWLGWSEFDAGRTEAARERFRRACGLGEDCALALAGDGALALAAGDVAAAETALTRALALDPDGARANLTLGRLELGRGRYDEAVTAFVRAKRADASGAEAWAGLGEAYLALGRTDEAEKQLEEALDRRPGDRRASLLLIGSLIEGGRVAEARVRLEAARTRFPDSLELLLFEAAVQAEDAPREAIATLEDALARIEASGATPAGSGDPSRASGEAGASEIGDSESGGSSGVANVARGAADAGTSPAELGARASLLLAQLLLEEGRFEEALRRFEAAAAGVDWLAAPAELWRGSAWCQFELGRYEQAAASFDEAARLAPRDARTQLDLGVLRMVYLGEREAARAHFEAYLDLDGSDPRVGEWLNEL